MADKLHSLKIQRDVYEKVLDGWRPQEIIDYCKYNYDLNKEGVRTRIKKAQAEISSIRDQKAESVVKMHLGRYEELYNIAVKWGMGLKAMQIMKAKETLLGLIKDEAGMSLTINKNTLVVGTATHDFERLEPKRKERLVSLLQKIGAYGHRSVGNSDHKGSLQE